MRLHEFTEQTVTEVAPLAVRAVSGATVGALTGIGGALIGSMFGGVLGSVAGAAFGGVTGANAGVNAADAIWDKVASMFGSDEKAAQYGIAHAQAAQAGEQKFQFNGKTYPVTLKPQEAKPAVDALNAVKEGIVPAEKLDELTGWSQATQKRDTPQPKRPTFAELAKRSTDKRSTLQRQKDGGKKNWFAEDVSVAEAQNDYFKRRKDEEDRIAGTKAPAKRTPKQTDYEKKRKQQGVAEGYAGIDDTDTVGFYLDSEAAYTAVMAKFGEHIDYDETDGIMYVPASMWPNVEAVAFDADGVGATKDYDFEHPDSPEQDMAEGTQSTTWVVHYDYGPHQSNEVKVKASSEDDARAKAVRWAKTHGHSSIMINRASVAEEVKEGSDWETNHDEFTTVGDRATPEQINKITSALDDAAARAVDKRGVVNSIFGKQSNGDLARKAFSAQVLSKNIKRNSNAKPGTDERKELGQHLVYAASLLKSIKEGVAEGSDWHGSDTDRDWYDGYKDAPVRVKVKNTSGMGGQPAGTYTVRSFTKVGPNNAEFTVNSQGREMTASLDLDKPKTYIDKNYDKQYAYDFYSGRMPITPRQAFNLIQVKKQPSNIGKKGVAENKGVTHRYQMTHPDGTKMKFTASDDADAKRQAKAHGATSLSKFKEQGVAENEKIGGRYEPEEFDAMLGRLKKLAGQGELKTVWDPIKRVYKNVPINQDNK